MFTYLALGDSYTIGESVATEHNFPHQLANLLRHQFGLSIEAPRVIATTGWTTNELQTGITSQSPIGTYDFCTLLIGVNNQYRGYSIEQFSREFTQLLYQAILYSKKGREGVFVLSIPDWGVTPFANDRDTQKIAKEIAQYNLLKKSICQMNKVAFIDITPSTIAHGADANYLVADLLHYNEKEYAIWAAMLAPLVAKVLSRD